MTGLVRRALARKQATPDAGVAMVVVLGVMLVGAIITTTLAMVTLFNTRNTLENRVEMRALQSADAGLDLMLSLFEGKKYNQMYQACSRDFVINNDAVHVSTTFTLVSGAEVACPSSTDVITSVTVESTATTEVVPLSGELVERTVAASFAPTPPEVMLDKAIFSEGSLTLTNNMEILASGALNGAGQPVYDANVYANGSVNCKTQSAVGGSIYAAQSYVVLENQCGVKSTVWAKDYLLMSSGVTVEGDVYTEAFTKYNNSGVAYGIYLANNNAKITGSALTNASIHLQDGASIGGAAYSREGQIDFSNNGSIIGGSAYARTKLAFNNGGKVNGSAFVSAGTITSSNSGTIGGDARASGTITGPVTAANKYPNQPFTMPTTLSPHPVLPVGLGFPGALTRPPREDMPRLNLSVASGERAKWVNAGWAAVTLTPSECTGSQLVSKLNNLSGSKTIVFFDACTSTPVIDNATLTLQVDVALVLPRGFTSNNQLNVKSSDLTQVRKLYLMTPADAAGVSWSGPTPTCTSPAANITINKAQSIQSVEWFIYTPCAVNWANGIANSGGRFVGQVYAGSVSLLSNFPMTMKVAPVPSLSTVVPVTTDEAKLTMSSRFDVRD